MPRPRRSSRRLAGAKSPPSRSLWKEAVSSRASWISFSTPPDGKARLRPMTSRQRLLYAALIVALMGGVALWRMDLFLQAFHVTMRQLERGGPARWRILGEVVLFGAILLMTLRVVPLRVEPKRDAAVALSATLLGWI